jgi:hypothetical protein
MKIMLFIVSVVHGQCVFKIMAATFFIRIPYWSERAFDWYEFSHAQLVVVVVGGSLLLHCGF